MAKRTNQAVKNRANVQRYRQRMRAQGLKLLQIWVPDTKAPGFAEKMREQARAEATWARTAAGRAEMEFWEAAAADAWGDFDEAAPTNEQIDGRPGEANSKSRRRHG
jgi:hypothetical protein